MDRHDFLELCQRVSLYPEVRGTRKVPPELAVTYDGVKYYPVSYLLTFDTGKTVHKAILHDLKANSEVVCLLSDVEKNQEGEALAGRERHEDVQDYEKKPEVL